MAKKKIDEKFMEGFIQHLRDVQHIGFDLDEFDADDVTTVGEIVDGVFQYIGSVLGDNKSETEPFELELPGYGTFKVSYREGAEGNWGIGFTAGSELKKRIKGDGEIEEITTDEDDE